MKEFKYFVIVIFLNIILVACSSINETPFFTLDWKLDENEVIGYRTSMNSVDSAETMIVFDLEQLIGEDTNYSEISQQLGNLTIPEVSSMISILKPNEQGNISVQMIFEEVNTTENAENSDFGNALNDFMESMEGTVQLRGEITPNGAITSFFLEQKQRNLLALFFELPTHPVKVGDTWQLNFNCISMGAGFIADRFERTNQVELTYVSKTPEGELIAVLDYVMLEHVEGTFQTSFSGDETPTSMSCGFLGRGHFLIEQGRWEQFTGEFLLNSTGLLTSNNTQQFALTPLDEIPEEYLNMR